MKEMRIGRSNILVKDYECSNDGVYFHKEHLRLWLYVNLTDDCPAACPFCVNRMARENDVRSLDPKRFQHVLRVISPNISGVSLTGGEPMSNIPLLEEIVAVIRETIKPEVELDMVTNGHNIHLLPILKGIDRFATVHISRHAVDDEVNRRLMAWPQAPSETEMKETFAALADPGMTVLNCVLQAGGVQDLASVREYLEMAADIGAANVSLIGMFPVNDYCRSHYVSPDSMDYCADERFTIWNHFHDHEYCQCSTGDYQAKSRNIRYYWRCPGHVPSPSYCRQLVYGPDNLLRQGFGDAPVIDL